MTVCSFNFVKFSKYFHFKKDKMTQYFRTPLHAILGLLTPQDHGVPAALLQQHPSLATALYTLIYSLVSNAETYEPTLRFLRSSCDFLCAQLACVTAILEKVIPLIR